VHHNTEFRYTWKRGGRRAVTSSWPGRGRPSTSVSSSIRNCGVSMISCTEGVVPVTSAAAAGSTVLACSRASGIVVSLTTADRESSCGGGPRLTSPDRHSVPPNNKHSQPSPPRSERGVERLTLAALPAASLEHGRAPRHPLLWLGSLRNCRRIRIPIGGRVGSLLALSLERHLGSDDSSPPPTRTTITTTRRRGRGRSRRCPNRNRIGQRGGLGD
jgi:hypothetical protein